MSFIDVLEEVEITSSRIEKERLLCRQTVDDIEMLKKVFLYALNPYKTFFISSIKPVAKPKKGGVSKSETLQSLGFASAPGTEKERFGQLFALLDRLADREVTGGDARRMLDNLLADMSEREAKWATRIVVKKLRCGVSEETIEKIWPGLVPRFDVQLAEKVEFNAAVNFEDLRPTTPLIYPMWADGKIDGLRCVAFISKAGIELRSRNGQVYEDFPTIVKALTCLQLGGAEAVLDCEIRGQDWNETQSIAFSSKNKKDDRNLCLNVFDIVPLQTWINRLKSDPYEERRHRVDTLLSDSYNALSFAGFQDKIISVPGRIVNSNTEMLTFFEEMVRKGYEGIMLKSLAAPYTFGRSSNVLKCKPTSTHEGKIVAFFEGKAGGKREGKLGGFIVRLPNGVDTRVGGGFKDSELEDFFQQGEETLRGRIVECKAQFLTKEGRMLFPRFYRFRDSADVSHEVNAIDVGLIHVRVDGIEIGRVSNFTLSPNRKLETIEEIKVHVPVAIPGQCTVTLRCLDVQSEVVTLTQKDTKTT